MKTCPHTTDRMTAFIFSQRERRLLFSVLTLAPCIGQKPTARFTLDDFAKNVRQATYDMQRLAKELHTPERHEFSAIGSLKRVDWLRVAHQIMRSIDPAYAAHGQRR